MRAVHLLRVQPDVAAARRPGRQLVVLPVRAPGEDLISAAGHIAEWPARLRLRLLDAALRLQHARALQLAADVRHVLLALHAAELVEHALQIVELLFAGGDERRQVTLRGHGLFIFPVGRGGVLLRRFQRVEPDLHLRAALGVIIRAEQRARALLRAVEVGGYEVAAAAQLLAVGGLLQLLALLGQLARLPVAQRAHALHRVVRRAAHPLRPVAPGVALVEQGGKTLPPLAARRLAVLRDAHVRHVRGFAVHQQQRGRELSCRHALAEGVHGRAHALR